MVCAKCGSPLHGGAKFCSTCGQAAASEPVYAPPEKKLTRPREGRMIAGVCAGVAAYTGWDVALVRVVAVVALFLGVGMPLLAYVIGWIVMPEAPYALPAGYGANVPPGGGSNPPGPGTGF